MRIWGQGGTLHSFVPQLSFSLLDVNSVSEVSEVAPSCLTLCDPVDCSPSGSSIHGILQARMLEWVAISFSRDLLDPGIEPRSPALQADALTSEPPGKLFFLQPFWVLG